MGKLGCTNEPDHHRERKDATIGKDSVASKSKSLLLIEVEPLCYFLQDLPSKHQYHDTVIYQKDPPVLRHKEYVQAVFSQT